MTKHLSHVVQFIEQLVARRVIGSVQCEVSAALK